jgi:peptidoglycan/LPS O-acetylase OafA/YrhL
MPFLDGLRAFAIVAMVLNHTARWWIGGSFGWPRYT